jgi:NADH:ubiquinone oxidoreductase subunit 6 (subunit J)
VGVRAGVAAAMDVVVRIATRPVAIAVPGGPAARPESRQRRRQHREQPVRLDEAALVHRALEPVALLADVRDLGLAMIVCFLALAGLYVNLGAPMVAAAQVIVYIGAISVLILFAIMLTQDKAAPSRLVFQTQAAPAAVAAIIGGLQVAVAAYGTDWGAATKVAHIATDALAQIIFGSDRPQYMLSFEAVSVLLLAAVIGGVFLAKREDPSQDAI